MYYTKCLKTTCAFRACLPTLADWIIWHMNDANSCTPDPSILHMRRKKKKIAGVIKTHQGCLQPFVEVASGVSLFVLFLFFGGWGAIRASQPHAAMSVTDVQVCLWVSGRPGDLRQFCFSHQGLRRSPSREGICPKGVIMKWDIFMI